MKCRLCLLTPLIALCSLAQTWADEPSASTPTQGGPAAADQGIVFKTLRETHPRVLATGEEFTKLREEVKESPELSRWFGLLQTEGAALLKTGDAASDKPANKSSTVLRRTLLLGLLYNMTGDKRYAVRLWQDLEGAMALPDWNPRHHFLTTAEMTAALGIAYDWLYEAWTQKQRDQLRQAIIDKGLNPGLGVYRLAASGGPSDAAFDGWPKVNHNWNQVCNGGLLLGALAIADEHCEPARQVVEAALASLPLALNEYGPDGAWGEGPKYWAFATEYTVYALAALQSALGTDFGFSTKPGMNVTGDFPRHAAGPTGLLFNFADGGVGPLGGYPQFFWLATAYNAPRWAALQLPYAAGKPQPLDLLWGARWVRNQPKDEPLALARHFARQEVVTLRSAWDDPAALFVGIKGGDNKTNHSHLDLGSFVFDALGQRWAHDPGPDSYALPGYFHQRRWTYYRLRAEGHNTLVLNPGNWPDQDPRATARVARFSDTPGREFAIVDLSDAYSGDARLARRGIQLVGGKQLVIQDELTFDAPADLWWFMHTGAAIRCNGATADLTSGGEHLRAQILEPAGARFEELPAKPLPSNPNPGGQLSREVRGSPKELRKLAIHIPDARDSLRLVVVLTPQPKGQQATTPEVPAVVPLDQWDDK